MIRVFIKSLVLNLEMNRKDSILKSVRKRTDAGQKDDGK